MFGVPGATPKNLLVQWILQRQLRAAAEKHLRGRLVDIGCGEKPWRELYAPYVEEHIGIDHPQTLHDRRSIDVFGTSYAIPARDASFDSAVSTAVLEHLEEPEQALQECHRVLKPGGTAIYTVPFIWHLHEEPRDFYRFTNHALRYLFEKVGFEVLELQALSGFWVTFGQLFVYNLHRFNRGPLKWLKIIDILGLLIQGMVLLLDKLDRTERWTWMYLVVARKTAPEAATAECSIEAEQRASAVSAPETAEAAVTSG